MNWVFSYSGHYKLINYAYIEVQFSSEIENHVPGSITHNNYFFAHLNAGTVVNMKSDLFDHEYIKSLLNWNLVTTLQQITILFRYSRHLLATYYLSS